jgi:xylulokinase
VVALRRRCDSIRAVIAGIDLGTQGVKVLLLGSGFRSRGKAFASYPTLYPRPGWAEQEPVRWELALGTAMREALGQAGARPAEVRAIGITGQLDGCCAVDGEGLSITPCLIWMDRRARLGLSPAMRARIRSLGGVNPDPGHMAAKVRWLLDNIPACADAACFHQPVSYMVRRLTGKNLYDHGLASTTMLYDLGARGYDDTLLEAFGVERGRLPRIASAESVAGVLTPTGAELSGLAEGTPVAVGCGDDFASPLGAGLLEPGSVACVSGTAEVVGALSTRPVIDPEGLVETHEYPGGSWFIENPGWLSGGSLHWFTDVFRMTGLEEAVQRAAEAPPGAGGVIFLPALSGSMSPAWVPSARGCFYGMTPAHTTAHMARAVLEGCAFAMRDVIERLNALAVPARQVLLMGGGAKSRLWASIRADVCHLSVRRVLDVDTAPMGAAMLAAVAAGVQPDLRSCTEQVTGEGEDIAPDPAASTACEKSYRSYRRLFDSLRPMFLHEEDS